MKIYTFNNKVLTRNTKWLKEYEEPTPPTPSLPPYTIRMRFTEGVTPSFSKGTLTQVSSSPNVWDLTYEDSDWSDLCYEQSSLIEVIGANTTGVTYMTDMFMSCTSLTTVPLFDTSSVVHMGYMFQGCTSLTAVPLFVTSSCTSMSSMFAGCTLLTTAPLFDTSSCQYLTSMFNSCTSLTAVPLFNTSSCEYMGAMFMNCYNVQSGALALYQHASTQSPNLEGYDGCFSDCGSNTVTGAAELAQIPSDWGGTAS